MKTIIKFTYFQMRKRHINKAPIRIRYGKLEMNVRQTCDTISIKKNDCAAHDTDCLKIVWYDRRKKKVNKTSSQ